MNKSHRERLSSPADAPARLEPLEPRVLLSGTPFFEDGPQRIGAGATVIEAEDFDRGGQGVAYNEAESENRGGAYRTAEGVDVVRNDAASNGHRVGYTVSGEWLEYTVDVERAGAYELAVRHSGVPSGERAVSLASDGEDLTGRLNLAPTGGWATYATTTDSVRLEAGEQVLRLNLLNGGHDVDWLRLEGTALDPVRSTFGNDGQPWRIGTDATTRIEAENFDQGPNGDAYLELNNRTGGQETSRPDAPGVAAANGRIGWFAEGEFLGYTVDVETFGTWRVGVRGGAANDTTFRITSDGRDLSGELTFKSTGGFGTYQEQSYDLLIGPGVQDLRIEKISGGGLNLDAYTFTFVPQQSPYGNGGNPRVIGSESPTRVQAEDFDLGGQGTAYNEVDAERFGDSLLRAPGTVDLQTTSDAGGGLNVGWIQAGEWLEYTVDVAESGTYQLQARVASAPGGGALRVSSNGADLTGEIGVDGTGGWQSWTTLAVDVELETGRQVLRVDMLAGGFNFNWLEFRKTDAGTGNPDGPTGPDTPTGPDAPGGSLVDASFFNNRDYAFAEGLLTDQGRMNAEIRAEYDNWKSRYVQRPSQAYINENGGGEMRFITGFDQRFGDNPRGAVSEGLGYGLVLSALADDQETFDLLWRFTETKLNGNGLIEWLYNEAGYTTNFAGGSGSVNATDGDLDAAYGLLVAAAKWGGGYADDARDLIGNILEHNVTDANQLNSGDDGYNQATQTAELNRRTVTSYLSPGYFRMFADFTGNTRWDAVADVSTAQLKQNQASIRAANGNQDQGGQGLFSFRMKADGSFDDQTDGSQWNSDVARITWRIATDYAWFGGDGSRTMMEDFNKFTRRQGIDQMFERYDRFGNETSETNWAGTDAGWNAMSMATSLFLSTNQGERDLAWNMLQSAYTGGYYSGSTTLLGMMTAGGWYQNPVVPR